MKYAVIRVGGKQYRVSQGEEVLVDKLADPKVEPEVLLMVNEGKALVGKPTVRGAKVKIKIVKESEKGEKIYVTKFKAKSRYRRRTGFRPVYTRLLVEKISK